MILLYICLKGGHFKNGIRRIREKAEVRDHWAVTPKSKQEIFQTSFDHPWDDFSWVSKEAIYDKQFSALGPEANQNDQEGEKDEKKGMAWSEE